MEDQRDMISTTTVAQSRSGKMKFIIPIIALSVIVVALGACIAVLLLSQDNQDKAKVDSPKAPEIAADTDEDTTYHATWDLTEVSALTRTDAEQIAAMYDDVVFNVEDLTGQKSIYNSPIYPYQWVDVSALPHNAANNYESELNAAVYIYRASPTSAWQPGFGAQDMPSCESDEFNTERSKAFATVTCFYVNENDREITTTIGSYKKLWF